MFGYVIKDLSAVSRYLPYGLAAGVLAVLILDAVNRARIRKGKESFSIVPGSILCVYLVIMLFITFLSRENGSRNGIDLELFSTWGINKRNNAFVIENILLFVPYGFICAWALQGAKRLIPNAMLGLATSLGIETMQLVTRRGYFQIDDVLTNTMGMVIGYLIFRVLSLIGKGVSVLFKP